MNRLDPDLDLDLHQITSTHKYQSSKYVYKNLWIIHWEINENVETQHTVLKILDLLMKSRFFLGLCGTCPPSFNEIEVVFAQSCEQTVKQPWKHNLLSVAFLSDHNRHSEELI